MIATAHLPGEGERTLFCDPGYDVREQPSSASVVMGLEADWRKSQRDPTTSVLRLAEPH